MEKLMPNTHQIFSVGDIVLEPFSLLKEDQLKMILDWRNHPDVRKWMNTTDTIGWESHKQFVKNLEINTTRADYLGILNQQPIGVVNLTQINFVQKTAYWGIYVNPSLTSPVGQPLIEAILGLAFLTFGLDELFAEVLKTNSRLIQYHMRIWKMSLEKEDDHRVFLKMSKELFLKRNQLSKKESGAL